jgi:histidine triad (HIT) family protein
MARAGCVFCDVVAGRTPAAEVYRDESCVGFLDHRPLFPGHVLLVPRRHAEVLTDLEPAEVGPFFRAAQRLAAAVEQGMDAEGTFVAMNNRISQSVPHLHVHIVPRRKGDGLKGFFWPRHAYAGGEMEAAAAAIRAALSPAPPPAGGPGTL